MSAGAPQTKPRLFQPLAVMAIMFVTIGVAGCRAHWNWYSTEITITRASDGQPASGASFRILYVPNSFFLSNTPTRMMGTTDANGKAFVSLADFRDGMIRFDLNDHGQRWNCLLPPESVNHGGPIERAIGLPAEADSWYTVKLMPAVAEVH